MCDVKSGCAVNLVDLIMPRAKCGCRGGEERLPIVSRTAMSERTVHRDAIQTVRKIDAIEQHMLNKPAHQRDQVCFRKPCCSVAAWHAFANNGSQLTKVLLKQ
jgi:hypothetical protein